MEYQICKSHIEQVSHLISCVCSVVGGAGSCPCGVFLRSIYRSLYPFTSSNAITDQRVWVVTALPSLFSSALKLLSNGCTLWGTLLLSQFRADSFLLVLLSFLAFYLRYCLVFLTTSFDPASFLLKNFSMASRKSVACKLFSDYKVSFLLAFKFGCF